MTPERWQQVKQIFQSAIERPRAERAGFISNACANDPELRSEVESLFSSLDQAGEFIQPVAADAATEVLADHVTESVVGKQIGHYKVRRLIGRGGMGEVFLAEDTSLGRKVALKLLRREFTTNEERLRRFQQEARAASALNHPNILTIHEIQQADSLHFMATEYVEGETLRQHIASAPMTLGEVLDVAIQVAGLKRLLLPSRDFSGPTVQAAWNSSGEQKACGFRGSGPCATPARCDPRNPGLAGPLRRTCG